MKTIEFKSDLSSPYEWVASIKVGQSAKENDLLYKMAQSQDKWFHLDKGVSTHVYLSVNGTLSVSDEKRLLHTCAKLVKEHSKCNNKAKVIYLERKYLSKTEKSKSGEVQLKKTPYRM